MIWGNYDFHERLNIYILVYDLIYMYIEFYVRSGIIMI